MATSAASPIQPRRGNEAQRVAAPGSCYADLLRQVKAAGLLERRLGYYLTRIAVTGGFFIAAWTVFAVLGDSWWQLAVAVFLAVVFAQVGFLAHDAGHQQIFRSRRWNDRFARVVSNGLGGLSYGWWVDKHNRHHRHPNDLQRDPDVGRSVLAWSDAQADLQRGLSRSIARNQDRYFFPLLLLEAFSLQAVSIRRLAERKDHRRLETVLLLAHLAGGIVLLLLLMSPLHALAFIGVQQGLLGLYLGVSFAPNHKGMPLADAAWSSDFLRRQVLTSRNVRGGRLLAAACGGLNYQIEHHLFPSMPSRNLPRARQIVRRFCAEHAVSYSETTLFDSYVQVLRYLRAITPSPLPSRR